MSGQIGSGSVFALGTTGSINAVGITEGGGVWYTGSNFQGSQQFLKGDDLDTNINVTSIVQKHSASLFSNQTYPNGIFNNGFIYSFILILSLVYFFRFLLNMFISPGLFFIIYSFRKGMFNNSI